MHISLLAIYFVYIFSNRKIYRCIGVVWHRAFSKAPNYSIEFESARKREKQLKRHFIIGSCKILMHIYKIWILAFISAIFQYSSRKTSYDTYTPLSSGSTDTMSETTHVSRSPHTIISYYHYYYYYYLLGLWIDWFEARAAWREKCDKKERKQYISIKQNMHKHICHFVIQFEIRLIVFSLLH